MEQADIDILEAQRGDILDMLLELRETVARIETKIDTLEAEFGPVARKYSKLVGAIPGRRGSNGQAGYLWPGPPGSTGGRPRRV